MSQVLPGEVALRVGVESVHEGGGLRRVLGIEGVDHQSGILLAPHLARRLVEHLLHVLRHGLGAENAGEPRIGGQQIDRLLEGDGLCPRHVEKSLESVVRQAHTAAHAGDGLSHLRHVQLLAEAGLIAGDRADVFIRLQLLYQRADGGLVRVFI